MVGTTEGSQSVPLAVRNRPDEFKIEQGLHADQLPFLFQVRTGAHLEVVA